MNDKLQHDQLFSLIKSLSKAEKRNFKLFVKRIKDPETTKFVRLFDVMDKMDSYDESMILTKAENFQKAQLPNLKVHLYKQILACLRMLHSKHDIDLQLREQMDYAKVLYNKGLYKQSLKILERAKKKANEYKLSIPYLEILHYEKNTELQYINKSVDETAETLALESTKAEHSVNRLVVFSNLTLKLNGLFLQNGHIRNEREYNLVKRFFKINMPKYDYAELGFNEKLYLFRSHVWYYYLIQDFRMCYRYSQKWVDLFQENQFIYARPAAYLKGVNSLLAALFLINHKVKFDKVLAILMKFSEDPNLQMDRNLEILLFNYISKHQINKHFMEGSFAKGQKLIPEIDKKMQEYSTQLDIYDILILNYKIACLYFGSQSYELTCKYLSRIIEMKGVSVREDIQCFARILNLVSYYEAGNDYYVEKEIKSTYRFIGKMKDINKFQKVIFEFLYKLGKIYPDQLKKEFKILKKKLIEVAKDPYEKRPFLYFDIISWLESKIENRSVAEVISERGLSLSRKELI